ncbi:MAG: CHASE2 domain-containing protein [Bacteroidia bacterium]|nr:CHASE2 domain-containing protein [Bacteroidia bacterium]
MLGWLFRLVVVLSGGLLMEHIFPARGWGWRIHDLMYSRLSSVPPDTQIVIVDIAQLGRAELAQLLLKLSAAKPKVIAIDAIFPHLKSPHEDTLWMQALCAASERTSIYLACSLDLSHPIEKAPVVSVSQGIFTRCVSQAFANLLQGDTTARLVRECLLYTIAGKDTAFSLGASVALALVPSLRETLRTLPARLPIRYRGNLSHFYFLSGEEVITDSLSIGWLQNKAIFMGVADPMRRTMEDIFFSPLNKSFLNRSLPDMYGVVIHANITAMLTNLDFLKEIPTFQAILACFLAYLLLSIVSSQIHGGFWRALTIRTLQVALLWGAVELTFWLGGRGYWFPVEVLLWGILIGGEIEVWRCPRRPRFMA